jgi:L-aspartate oxidase
VSAVRRGGTHAPGGDPQLACAGDRVERSDPALPGRIERRARVFGGKLGEFRGDHTCASKDSHTPRAAHWSREHAGHEHAGGSHTGHEYTGDDCPGGQHPRGAGRDGRRYDGQRHGRCDSAGGENEHHAGGPPNNEHGERSKRESQAGQPTGKADARIRTPPRPRHGRTGEIAVQATRGGVELTVDVAVMGAGAAGLYAALCAARAGGRVALVSAAPLAQTASYWAQGGLAAALAEDDSPELHLQDTEHAGRGAMRRSAAEVLVAEAPECVRDLQALGVRFDADRFGRLALGLEGGHSVRRVVHAGGSATGRRLLRQLSALAVQEPRIAVLENVRAQALWRGGEDGEGRCGGVVCEDGRTIAARAVVLSTGGAAALWARTTNPPGSQGTGLLLGHALGAKLADLEFVQFHPTAVIGVPGREGFLITEAIRGEGATLHDAQGERFVDELAPRDEVARAIWARLQATGAQSVGLDMRGIDHALFPNVVGALREAGVDPARERVPVAPAAHYTMGGLVTDLHGHSTVAGLYAVGETSCTGLHGANRLASNSLSECFVWARRAAASALAEPAPTPANTGDLPASAVPQAPPIATAQTREALWQYAGIERSAEGLERLAQEGGRASHPLARLIARCALERRESRGAHRRVDHPETDPARERRHVVVGAEGELAWETWD